MSKLYGTEISEKPGHVLCKKCHTYYQERTGKQVCPWCNHPKPESTKPEVKGPTKTDLDLFNFLKTATEEQKARIVKFVEDNLV